MPGRPRAPTPLAPRKSLGQHFLHDQGVLTRIAALARPEEGSGIVEIGPGTGNLTAHLLGFGAPIICVERDRRMPAALRERFGEGLEIIEADAAQIDWLALLHRPELGPRPVVVGNLPYNASVAIMTAILDSGARPARVVAMVQKEVADRLVAPPSCSDYGRLSVKVQLLADARVVFKVPPGAFRPPPKVMSSVVVLEPLGEPRFAVPSFDWLLTLTRAGFGQRRKTLSNALKSAGLGPAEVRGALESIGVRPDARAEVIAPRGWTQLARLLEPPAPREAREPPPARGKS